ncbi:MAG TPA: amidohydrolase [Flavobacterium sp.]|jgi:amidohydrolase|uniref:amidohydrolase n=1 Tax=Flavobacterium sp. TaxID=239 RepID=UPI001B67755E|nr:amidohydrolase [Flavobacterium sp.]MBP6147288.1 amidohydrolase [Flavobacterium sp.]MBP7183550.1 amidohydrolase [Flavobacterium sp.]MBP7317731.1 amidohydrolase [Flavobacterium sp.]MBP8887531.1 amidohydrolase [Flavobacterium sp.]HRL71020.1 amidohydrolase [Flavobacterium sp.]
MKKIIFFAGLFTFSVFASAQNTALKATITQKATSLESKVITWRRDFHQNPELGNREFKTAEKIAAHLRSLGIEVQTGVAKTGVVGILKGGKPGPVVALRADIDALPIKERVNIPFASKAMGEYNGKIVPVMHACGHDTHTAILMGTAEILASIKSELKGTVKFIFQPAEEGPPEGEEGGAKLMVKEGVLENPKVDVIFGLHINAQTEVGKIKYRPKGTMAASDLYTIKINGKQTHGAYPWLGIDPITTAAQIIMGIQTIVSRNLNITESAAVISVGQINAGVRSNVIPEELTMTGTIRSLDSKVQDMMHSRLKKVVSSIAESAGATAEIKITNQTLITYNDPLLTEKMVPTLEITAGKDNVSITPAVTGAEDFSYFQEKIPGLYFFLGGAPKGKPIEETAPHHTPDFYIDESSFVLGMKALSNLTIDYMEMNAKK